MPVLRKSTLEDIVEMVRIAEEGRALLKSRGINQWQRGTYPDRPLFEQDVKDGIGYVVEEHNAILAVCAITFTDEASYRNLKSGKWLSRDEDCYATIHRSAVSAAHRGQGIAGFLFAEALRLAKENGAVSVRLDTHPDNLSMQKALQKAGFSYCGSFDILEGDEAGDLRYGYERLV